MPFAASDVNTSPFVPIPKQVKQIKQIKHIVVVTFFLKKKKRTCNIIIVVIQTVHVSKNEVAAAVPKRA